MGTQLMVFRNDTTRTMAFQEKSTLNMENLNPCVKVMAYAVRGPLLIRAGEIENELEKVRFCVCFPFVFYRVMSFSNVFDAFVEELMTWQMWCTLK